MYQRLEKIVQQYGWAVSFSIVLYLFLLFNLIATPLLNSGDDTFLMYTLGGGYGEGPSNLLHYNHIWHPWLGWIVKSLFDTFPGVNWYNILLLLFHIAGCTCILYTLLKRQKTPIAILLFIIAFFFIETRLLLSLTFTGAALVAGAGSMCLLVHQFQQRKAMSRDAVAALLLLLLCGMLRLQIAWMVIVLFASIAVTIIPRQQWLSFAASLVIVVVLLFGANKIHEHYYASNIPGWKQQEKFRQALFYAYNKQLVSIPPPGSFKDSTEQQLFFGGFLYDSVKFNTERIKEIGEKITRNRRLTNKDDQQGLYWFFIEMRVYILLFAVVILLLLTQRNFLPVRNWLLSFLAFLAVHCYLFIFQKITTPIHLGLLLFLWLALAMQLKKESPIYGRLKSIIPTGIMLLALSCWMAIRLIKENSENQERYQRFLCATKELNLQADHLFIATDDAFPLNYFYIWNTPKDYPAANLLYKDRLITHSYFNTLNRFSITNLEEALVNNKKVLLVGKNLPALENGKQPARLSAPFPVYKCLEVRQLNAHP
ncbi:MAG: hypothetical protein JNM19_11730 [Chitinophagaceae bacterium]|nr:hypothetical protein [Chitinophagaceae bacterium]